MGLERQHWSLELPRQSGIDVSRLWKEKMMERSGVPVGGLSFWDIRQIIKFHGARSLEAKPKATEIQGEFLVVLG